MRTASGAVALLVALSVTSSAQTSTKQAKRIEEAATVLKEIHAVPDKDVPQELWDKAACVIVVPSLKKAAFLIGGEYGKGLMSCRHGNDWSPPVFMEIEKGSWGLQFGAAQIDLVLLVMKERGMQKLLQDKVTLGAEASIAAGPIGRDARAGTDGQMNAEILRAHDAFVRCQGAERRRAEHDRYVCLHGRILRMCCPNR